MEGAFEWCQSCQNKMEIKVDKMSKKLYNYCKLCNERANMNSYLTKRTFIIKRQPFFLPPDIVDDPTLPRVQRVCEECNSDEAVFVRDTVWEEETGVIMYFICVNCRSVVEFQPGAHWKVLKNKANS